MDAPRGRGAPQKGSQVRYALPYLVARAEGVVSAACCCKGKGRKVCCDSLDQDGEICLCIDRTTCRTTRVYSEQHELNTYAISYGSLKDTRLVCCLLVTDRNRQSAHVNMNKLACKRLEAGGSNDLGAIQIHSRERHQ